MSAKFVIATLFETMYYFHVYGFETNATVCDGASTNLATIELLTGFGSGAYGTKAEGNKHEIKTWFRNPYTNQKVYALICPSHPVGRHSTCLKV